MQFSGLTEQLKAEDFIIFFRGIVGHDLPAIVGYFRKGKCIALE